MADDGSNFTGGENNHALDPQPPSEKLNIVVKHNNNEFHYKIKRTVLLGKLIDDFYRRQGKIPNSCRFLFDGQRVNPTDTATRFAMENGDTIEVHEEQIGGGC